MGTTLEKEVKLACDDLDRIRNAGFDLRLIKERHFEDNILLDSDDDRLLSQGAALRIRTVGGRGLVTYKGVVRAGDSPVKIREELESEATEPERVREIFDRLGYRPSFRYQKYRTVYALLLDGSELEVTFDELPIGNFIEIEGDEEKIERVLEAVGFSEGDIIRESYPELQAALCKARGVPLEDLIFRDHPTGL
ncbi:MAG TPA: class IV adenylate cyclase [Blastocatellia bacterium]|nr:class IV adenylate cyclase [Blastocatellia bacterium]